MMLIHQPLLDKTNDLFGIKPIEPPASRRRRVVGPSAAI